MMKHQHTLVVSAKKQNKDLKKNVAEQKIGDLNMIQEIETMIGMIETEIIVIKINMNVIKTGIIGIEIEVIVIEIDMIVIIVIKINIEMIDTVETEIMVVNQTVGKIIVKEVNYVVIMIVTVFTDRVAVTVVVCGVESQIGRKRLPDLTGGMMITILHW